MEKSNIERSEKMSGQKKAENFRGTNDYAVTAYVLRKYGTADNFMKAFKKKYKVVKWNTSLIIL